MKGILKLILATLFLSSCNSNSEDRNETQTINPNEIQLNEIVHDTLTSEQIIKIKKYIWLFKKLTI